MSLNADVDGVVRLNPDGAEAERSVSAPVESVGIAQTEIGPPAKTSAMLPQPEFGEAALVVPPTAPEVQPTWIALEPAKAPDRPRGRRAWIGAVAVGAAGVVAAGTLGYFLYSTTGERDAARRHAASTQATLTTTEGTLTATRQELEARKAIAAYTTMYITDSGRVRIDYQKLVACTTFGSCRTAAQSALSDMQTFQSDRSAGAVPSAVSNSDAMLRDALSAAIAADQELISGMDNGNVKRIDDGWRKLDAAMLSVAKAEAVLGAELK